VRLRLDLAYDGAGFHGWARQPGLRTVQGEVEAAIATVLRLDSPVTLTVAGRTDTGVHARGQVAHVDLAEDLDPAVLERRLRRVLADDLSVRAVAAAPDGFDARFSALERRYVYRLTDGAPDPLVRSTVVAVNRPIDVPAMDEAAEHLIGEHDFAAFCKKRDGATTIRTLLELSSNRIDGRIETTVRADAFCHSMVRALMGALVAVGEGRYEPEWAGEILAGAARDPRVRVMPAHGLTLEEVRYPPDHLLAARVAESRRRRDEP
jgi:tRNA pseudouridine38-40 synthase